MALPMAMHQEPCALSLRQVAERLTAVLWRSPESWLALQLNSTTGIIACS
jgi:hypothetical protein